MVMSETEVKSKETSKKEETPKESTLYYFYSQGCGWCKKSEPHVDELNKKGYNILKLDLADGDNNKLKNEISKEYNVQCGTPWFVDGETGNSICGFREIDIIEKWANGEEIPAPPRPKGPIPKLPFHGASKKEITEWKKLYKVWLKDNDHMPKNQLKSADDLLAMPRPKTDPPKPPVPNSSPEDIDKWGEEYDVWKKENDHLPNLQPTDQIVQRMKSRGAPPMAPNTCQMPGSGPRNARLDDIEAKLDRLMDHLGVK